MKDWRFVGNKSIFVSVCIVFLCVLSGCQNNTVPSVEDIDNEIDTISSIVDDELLHDNGGDIDTLGYALRSTIWTTRSIPVCWEGGTNTFATERGWVRNSINRTWARYSDLSFVGWGACRNSSQGIRIRVNDSGPHVVALGRNLNGVRNGMTLNFSFNNWSRSCRSSQNRRENCIRSIAVHEFGHAIGLAHEHNRPDRPSSCTDAPQGSNGDWFTTTYDANSVMNYCNPRYNNGGVLSQRDIRTVRILYGVNGFSALHRWYSPSARDHFYTSNSNGEIAPRVGYRSEGIVGYVARSRKPNTTPLYRLYSPSANDHFYTTSSTERDIARSRLGYNYEGIVGYVYSSQQSNTLPVYRWYSPSAQDHFYTTNPRGEIAPQVGYVSEGIAFYIRRPF